MNRKQQFHDSHVRTWQRSRYSLHVTAWAKFRRDQRFWSVWYSGRISRMTQLKQLCERGEMAAYIWLKAFWRDQLLKLVVLA